MFHQTSDIQSEHIGPDTRIWQFCVILPGARIGAGCNICSHVFIENDVVIGDRVTIKCGVQIWDGITIEDEVFIGSNASFCNDRYPRSGNKAFNREKTLIRKGASIGAGAVILPGLVIGEMAMVAAGAVVTKDVQPSTTVAGNPAQEVSNN
jgi:acetyltransferase-like isoleucine patch superfamily enzyme